MPWAARRRSLAGSWNGTRIICWSSRPIRKAFLAIRACCEQPCFARGPTGRPVFDAFDDSHGRLVRRRVFACPEAASLEALRAWPGLRTVLAVETIRGVNGSGTVEAESRYVLSSCGDDPKVLDPKVLDPKVLDPKVLDPKVLDPKVLDPKVLDPKVLDPKVLIQA